MILNFQLLREGTTSILEILKVVLIASVDVPMQVSSWYLISLNDITKFVLKSCYPLIFSMLI